MKIFSISTLASFTAALLAVIIATNMNSNANEEESKRIFARINTLGEGNVSYINAKSISSTPDSRGYRLMKEELFFYISDDLFIVRCLNQPSGLFLEVESSNQVMIEVGISLCLAILEKGIDVDNIDLEMHFTTSIAKEAGDS